MNDSLLNAILENHQHQLDSLVTGFNTQLDAVAALASKSPSLELINQTHTFYNDAWVNLTVLIGATVGLFGVFIPLLLLYLQRKDLDARLELPKLDSLLVLMML